MTEPWEWEESDLQSLVDNQASESLELDFKECGALAKTDGKKRELSKDVSAFANSAGGTLVYGIVEDKKTHTAASLDEGYDPSDISQEWIEQVINSNIHPRLSGVRINRVSLSGSRQGKVAYVVYVPQGSTAHQAADKRYYKRFNFESVPMEDYEVRDVMQRVTSAQLETQLFVGGVTSGSATFNQYGDWLRSPNIDVVVANRPHAGIAQFSQHKIFLQATLKQYSDVRFRASTTRTKVPGGHWEYGSWAFQFGTTDSPIFSDEERNLFGFQFEVDSRWPFDRPSPFVLWRTWAAGSSPTDGAVLFTRVANNVWDFRPASIEELGDMGMTVEFGR